MIFFTGFILPDGREKTLRAMGEVMTDANGDVEMMFGTLQDFTSQKLIQKELEDNQFFIQKITDLTPSLIAVYNMQTEKFLFMNRAVESLLGYKKEIVLNEGMDFFTAIIHPDDLPRIQGGNTDAHWKMPIKKEHRIMNGSLNSAIACEMKWRISVV